MEQEVQAVEEREEGPIEPQELLVGQRLVAAAQPLVDGRQIPLAVDRFQNGGAVTTSIQF